MKRTLTAAAVAALHAAGCAGVKPYLDQHLPPPTGETRIAKSAAADNPIQPASAEQLPTPQPVPEQPALPTSPRTVDEFAQLAVARNPRLAKATLAIDAARGRYTQAGLYPNPEVSIDWQDIGDRVAAGGVLTAPGFTQTIVTGQKLSLSQAVEAKAIDRVTLELLAERYAIIGAVRSQFYAALAAQQRAEILTELANLAQDAVNTGETLLKNERIARLDVVQLEVERERFRAEAQAVTNELPAAYQQLAATTGDSALSVESVAGSLDALPEYNLEQVRTAVLASHPEVLAAKVSVEQAQAAVRRAEAEPIPDVTVFGGFIRQFENHSYDGAFGLSMPIPVWNKNQGNIRAAQAELGMAMAEIGRVQNELAGRVATAFQTYTAARVRAERYRREIIPRAEETYNLSLKAFQGGQFEYLRVIQAQRAVAEARLELNTALGEAWEAAGELSGLLLEETWPPRE